MVKAGFHLARKNGKAAFVASVFGKSPADVETFENEEVFEAMIAGSETALSETHTAHLSFSRQVVIQETTDWRSVVDNLKGRVPVHFFNGLQDPKVAPETLKEFQEDYPWIDFRIYKQAGQLVFFRCWRDVMDVAMRYL